MIIGIDEVGRGAWAGPLAVGAVAIEPDIVPGLADSKTLSLKRREELACRIRMQADWIGIGWASAAQIDRLGITAALKLAAARAMQYAPEDADIIIDGTVKLIGSMRVSTLKKADQLIPAVSAAAIIAKVARDRYMRSLPASFKGYAFDAHVGYGTAAHQAALDRLGPSRIHRMSFAPMSNHVPQVREQPIEPRAGAIAEQAVANYLQRHGFEIIDCNWRTKLCEIDIIACKADSVYFIEVKYRRTGDSGEGFAYITREKQRQMAFAARAWTAVRQWRGPVQLAAAQVTGNDFEVTGFTTEISLDEDTRAHTRRFG